MSNSDDYIGFVISDVARLMRTVFDRQVRGLGLTRSQWILITRLHRRPGASQSELAEMMEIERAPAGRLIDRLEAKGWVLRRVDPKDRRINRIYLSAEAEAIHKRIWKVAEATVDRALVDLTRDDAQRLASLLLRVKGRLIKLAGETPETRVGGASRARPMNSGGRSANTRRIRAVDKVGV